MTVYDKHEQDHSLCHSIYYSKNISLFFLSLWKTGMMLIWTDTFIVALTILQVMRYCARFTCSWPREKLKLCHFLPSLHRSLDLLFLHIQCLFWRWFYFMWHCTEYHDYSTLPIEDYFFTHDNVDLLIVPAEVEYLDLSEHLLSHLVPTLGDDLDGKLLSHVSVSTRGYPRVSPTT